MKTYYPKIRHLVAMGLAACLVPNAFGIPLITEVVETGGDNEATDTIAAKWTGVTWNSTVANEPLLNTPAGTPYTVPLFDEDVPCYVDRAHQWNGATVDLPIPDYLKGGEYIMSGNDNRDNADYRLDITVSDAAIVYLLIDNRYPDGDNTTPPNYAEGVDPAFWTTALSWMGQEGFAPVFNGINRTSDPSFPDEIGVDEGGNGTGPGGDIQQWSSIYAKTLSGPGKVSVFMPDNASRNMYGVVVKRLPTSINNPPAIANLKPSNNTLFYLAAGGLSFSATTISPNSIAATNIKLSLNDVDVSAGLTVSGTGSSRSVAFNGLVADTLYSARIIVADQAGRSTTNEFVFDTFTAASVIAIEAEDYNYESGKTMASSAPGTYAGLVGTKGVDFNNNNGTVAATLYRAGDLIGIAASGDVARAEFTAASVTDYVVNAVEAKDWLNYTRTLADRTYAVYLRGASAVRQQLRLDRVVGATSAAQTVESLGIFRWQPVAGAAYSYAPLTDPTGVPVLLRFSGLQTLRLTALNANADLQLNYLLLVPTTAAASPAYLSDATPLPNVVGAPIDAAVKITIANGVTKAVQGSIAVAFNGTDVTAATAISATSHGWNVSYDPPGYLASGSTYSVSLSFKDDAGAAVTRNWSFGTAVSLIVVPSNFSTPPGSGQTAGMKLKMRKASNYDPLGAAFTLANTAARADQQLSDTLIDPNTLEPYLNEAGGPAGNGLADGTVVNFDQLAAATGYFGGDEAFPYVDLSLDPDPNNLALEATMFVEFAEGLVRLGVRSDDGFRLTTGPNLAEATAVLGVYEGGRGNGLPGGTTEFEFKVEAAGVYPLRLIWYEGNGGANVEFYSVDRDTGSKILVNDAAHSKALKAFRTRSADIQVPTVSITAPAPGAKFAEGPVQVDLAASASVSGSQIAKVEFFAGVTKLGEDTTAPYTYSWTGVPSGRYSVSAVATDVRGLSRTSAAVAFMVGRPIMVNFQAASSEGYPDYLQDLGDVFGDRGNGYSYGWDVDNTANARDRNDARAPDERYDTFNHSQKPQPAGSYWEIEIPNGRYNVFAAAGEAANIDSVYDLTAEGVTIVKGTPTDTVRFFENQGAVTVKDGKLTIGNGPTAANNKVCFVEIYTLPAEVPKPVLSPPTLADGKITITWTEGGTLQEATSVNGPWSNVPGNPAGTYTTSASGALKFYRVIVP